MHGHTNQLFGHFHGNFVVADEQELSFFAHRFDEFCIALSVGVVERRIDLVQQAKRCRVKLKNGKYQRNGCQCFFTTRQQRNALVFLARWLGNHLHAGVQNLFARHSQLRITAAKKFGEHAAELLVDFVKGARQQVARFSVNFFDRVFKCGHGFVQVSRLRV